MRVELIGTTGSGQDARRRLVRVDGEDVFVPDTEFVILVGLVVAWLTTDGWVWKTDLVADETNAPKYMYRARKILKNLLGIGIANNRKGFYRLVSEHDWTLSDRLLTCDDHRVITLVRPLGRPCT